ncbi:(2Fe-2S)-binding protein [bacterium (Candidatus Blackallbacteria) CG17_big_fil_post_rev_8_21_14_2_50_48_46]|uniref:(2Fe-2S)-binding protein n=1 Tax=bacterium (Candidatus Blackallbacteria) CG17_big_fil_post_rev_8_21_14_2_50_48_46 TaxID=2014261 RepID=A0A2M7G9E6_9BACT|nr:MAG: (2Fe-2S)-binding protein [bacterium (Candidatus Blackallbacteria) CG18_big_fil_WC_8_21_14_2_50_49_26]PIW18725.1 MAG: (2Fe-2S)-binding protein [bacterium (Candidatus Blackallbacteria) CG17_big_fil_post_rev_8_21_14_2_50_48_46]PIW46603.1 MAG: (2Fe-2S)-binding protein [bacterium (Candidatus Blackallbacteria) CG13_big_fil_rev_8_21_14_2_50_49_14]
MQIDRCVCFQKTFNELKALALEQGIREIEALQESILFGKKCKLCHPYIREMLKTGQTEFYSLLTDSS